MTKEPARRAGPRLQLKSVEYFERMSQETPCFVAQVWWEDRHVADVENRGVGGCCMYSPSDRVRVDQDLSWHDIVCAMHLWADRLPDAPKYETLDHQVYKLLDNHLESTIYAHLQRS